MSHQVICARCGTENSEFNLRCRRCEAELELTVQNLQSAGTESWLAAPTSGESEGRDDVAAGTQMAQFLLRRKLGEGGMGTVYEAWDTELERPVALKMIRNAGLLTSEDQKNQLLAEAKMASALNHPNIVTIFGVFQDPRGTFIAMEWVDGDPLSSLIHEGGLPLADLIDLASAIAGGLAQAHKHGIIHRDIKPGNIMVTREGAVKILDFGLARFRDRGETGGGGPLAPNPLLTQPGSLKGTPAYMSPEQARGEALDVRSDVFSFGVLLYYMCSGCHPFAGTSASELLQFIQQQIPPELTRAELPVALGDLVMHCLAKERADRPAHMGEVAGALAGIREASAWRKGPVRVPTQQPLTGAPPRRLVRRWNWIALLLLVAIVAGWLGMRRQKAGIAAPPGAEDSLQSLAVLPFDNLTGDPALDIFCDGFSATINTALGHLALDHEGTWILPTGELRRLERIDTETLYQRFGVRHVLSASVKYVAGGLGFDLQLIRSDNLRLVGHASLVIGDNRLYESQDQLLDGVFQVIGWQVDASLRQTLAASSTRIAGAHRHYVQALGYRYRADREGNLERSEAALQEALVLDPQYVSALIALAETYRLMWAFDKTKGSVERGLAAVERALALRDDIGAAHTAHAYLLIEKGRYADAAGAFEAALAREPGQAVALYGLGRALAKAERFDEAEQAFARATQLSPNDWLGQTEVGRFYYGLGKLEKAEPIFRRLTELAPLNPKSQSNLAIILYAMERLEEALPRVERALELAPDGMLYTTYGTFLFFQGDYERAVAAFGEAVRLEPNRYSHYGNLGDANRQLGRVELAHNAYAEAIRLSREGLSVNPGDPELGVMLVHYLARSGDLEAARTQMHSLAEPVGSALSYYHALAHELLGERDQALTDLATALADEFPAFEVLHEPDLVDLRGDPRFAAIIAPYRTRQPSL